MKKIKKNIGQQKNGVSQQHYEADKDLVAKSGATFCVKVSIDPFLGNFLKNSMS